ncbi:MAG: ATP-binding protein [Acidobacteriota bacterium]|jgi:two-component system nitrogen regulation sensor histidine kinase NtrY
MTERRVRTERILILALVVLIAVLTALAFLLQRAEEVSPQFLASSLLLYSLSMLNVVLVLVLLFVVFRNLIKLLVERRRGVLGSRFRTKMVFTFVGMTLLPSMVVFAAALYLIQLSVDRWFSTPVDEITQMSQSVVDSVHDAVKSRAAAFADDLAETLRRGRLLELDQPELLRRRVETALRLRQLDFAEVLRPDGDAVSVMNPRIPATELTSLPETSLQGAFQGEPFQWMDRVGGGLLVRSVAPVRSSLSQDVVGVVVVGLFLPEDLTERTARITAANENYRQLKVGRVLVKRVYEFTFTLVGLLIVFAATWVGLFLARGFTAPVQALAESTREVAAGNLDHRIEVEARDEMGILIDSFNRMVQELKHSRGEIERSNLELQRSNTALEERRHYIERLLESITTGVISFDGAGRITTMNRAAYRMLRLERVGDMRGREAEDLFRSHGLDPLSDFLAEAKGSRSVNANREFHFGTEGRSFSLAVTLTTLEDARGGRPGVLMVVEDLTHLIRAQRIAAWREVARRMAHEIKNPLTPIQLSAQRIAKKHAEGAEDLDRVVRQGTETIVNEVNALKMLVNEFSRYARMPEVQAAPTDLHQVIDAAMALYEDVHAEVRFIRRFDPSTPEIALDREQMKRVFINLLENSLEAMQRQGTITVETRFLPNAGTVRIEVSDDGPGIRAEDRDRLFLPYFSTKKRGTGLGLAIVNRILTDHHGTIQAEDNAPRGAKFVIDLPAEAV